MHLAQAMIGDRDVDVVVTGARLGGKQHEILVSEEEAPATPASAGPPRAPARSGPEPRAARRHLRRRIPQIRPGYRLA